MMMDKRKVSQFLNWLYLLHNIPQEKRHYLDEFIVTLRHYERHKGSTFLLLVIKEVRIAL